MALSRVLAAAAAAVAVAGGGIATAAPAAPLGASAELRPAATLFGDPVSASVIVVLDRATVDARSVRVEPSFAPYAPTGPPKVTRRTSGARETLRYSYVLMCVDSGCLPGKHPLVVRFPPAAVSATSGRRTLNVRAVLPHLTVSSRLPAGATASASPHFRAPATVPAVRYSVSPTALSDLLVAATALLGAAGAALLARELARLSRDRRRRAAARRTPLEIALAYARQAARRPAAADRRKALGFLAEALDGRGDDALASSADAAAWAERPPDGARVLALADEVEAAVQEGRA